MTSQMNIYEFMILLAHIDATHEQMLTAGNEAAKALEIGSITHNSTAIDFMASAEAALDLGHQLMAQLKALPENWLMRGIPQSEICEQARATVKQRWLYQNQDEIHIYRPRVIKAKL